MPLGENFMELGSTPNDEDCTQAGDDVQAQKMECLALINQLIRMHGQPPAGMEYCLVRNNHDFGTYYEAGILYREPSEYDDWQVEDGIITQEEANMREAAAQIVLDYLNKCEQLPDKWDDEARQELHTMEHPRFTAKIVNLKRA